MQSSGVFWVKRWFHCEELTDPIHSYAVCAVAPTFFYREYEEDFYTTL